MTDHAPAAGTVVAVASDKGGVGKTATAVGLAGALADRGEETVVVDCDLRMPSVGRTLGLAPEVTLHDVLAGNATVGDAMVEADGFAAVTGDPRLDAVVETDHDLLGEMIARLRTTFDAVVLDSGPNVRTAASALQFADAGVVVATPRPPAVAAARRTADLLARSGVPVVGGVVARADPAGTDRTATALDELGRDAGTVVSVPEASAPEGDAAAAAYRRLAAAVVGYGSAATGSDEAPLVETDDDGATDAEADSQRGQDPSAEATELGQGGLLSALADRVRGRDGGASPVVFDPERGLSLSRRAVVEVVVAVQVLLVALVVAEPPIPLVRPVLGGAYALFLPGLPVALLLDLDRCSFARTAVYSVGLSAVVLVALGAGMSLAYPVAGIDRPLTEGPIHATLLFVVFGLCAAVLARGNERPVRIPVHGAFSPVPLALLVLPFVSVLGITFQNLSGNNTVLVVLLVGLSVLPVLNARGLIPSRWLPLAVWTVATALLYHNSLFGSSIGGPSGSAGALDAGTWHPGEESILPNAILFPIYVLLTDLRLGIEVSTLNPLLVSFMPVILFEGYRTQVGSRTAFSSACLFMFSFPFYTLYPAGGRVATPVFFLALEGLILCDEDVKQVQRHVLGILFGMGLAVSHYGTAYVAMVAFVTAFTTYLAIKGIDAVQATDQRILSWARWRAVVDHVRRHRPTLLSSSFVTFYGVFVLEWYFYTSGGEKFAVLPRKVVGVVNRFFEASASGTAASAVSKDYGSTAVALSRRLYIVVGALMGIGIATAMVARVFREEEIEIDDEFLALGAGLMSMLGASFFVVGFNVARIMMIVFTFTGVYVVLGAGSIVESLLTARRVLDAVVGREVRGAVGRLLGFDFRRALSGARTELTGVSVLLCVFLVLNAGVVTVLITHDYAPSNVITQQQLEKSDEVQVQLKANGCVNCNIESHRWLFAHRNRSHHAYGDYKAWAQVDFFRGALVEQLSYYPKKVVYRPLWAATNGTERPSLMLSLDHNDDTDVMIVDSMYYWKSLGYVQPVWNRSHVVYTTGETRIYRSSQRATKRVMDFRRPDPTNVTNVSEFRRIMNGTAGNGTVGNDTAGNATSSADTTGTSDTAATDANATSASDGNATAADRGPPAGPGSGGHGGEFVAAPGRLSTGRGNALPPS